MAGNEQALDLRPETALEQAQEQSPMALFERLARDPNASVEKIERLMALYERVEMKRAEEAFNVAMSAAQKEMRSIAADAYNPQTKSKYASYAALDKVLRPIYTMHGFALSFNTADSDKPDHIRVLCDVTLGGYSKQYRVDMAADGKGAKGGDVMTKTHAAGSAMSYGMRYLLKLIFNVAVGDDDDDGNTASGKPTPQPPPDEKFDIWVGDLEAAADEGWQQFKSAWNQASPAYREHYARMNPGAADRLKKKSLEVTRKAAQK